MDVIYHGILPVLCFNHRIERGDTPNSLGHLKFDVTIDPVLHRCIDAAARVNQAYPG